MDPKPSPWRALINRVFPPATDFFRLIGDQCAVAVEALDALESFMQAGIGGERVRELEHRGDDLKRRNMDELNRAFATPIDREDIFRAIISVDDVIDYAKTTVREMEILRVAPDEPMRQMTRLLHEGVVALRSGYAKLGDRPLSAEPHAEAAHKAERGVEKIYRAAVAELFDERRVAAHGGSPEALTAAVAEVLVTLRRREVYRHLSNAADRVETAAETLRNIVVKVA